MANGDLTQSSHPAARAANTADPSLATLSDVLGWRVKTTDAAGIRRALAGAFPIQSEGEKSIVSWRPRGLRVQLAQAGIGALTGAQRSLYDRGSATVEQIRALLDGLTPLTTDPDWDDVHAIESLLRSELDELVQQFGAEGGPVVVRVNHLLERLSRQIGKLGQRLGLGVSNVNTLDEELQWTKFQTIRDSIDTLKDIWSSWKKALTSRKGKRYLGTQSILIERHLTCIAETLEEIDAALDAASIGAAERAVIQFKVDNTPITLAELLNWISEVVTSSACTAIQEGGKDGIHLAVVPTLEKLERVLETLCEQCDKASATTMFAKLKPAPLLLLHNLKQQIGNAHRVADVIQRPEPTTR